MFGVAVDRISQTILLALLTNAAAAAASMLCVCVWMTRWYDISAFGVLDCIFLFLFLLSIAPALLRANVQSWQRCLTNAHTLAGSLAQRVRVFDRIQMQLGRLFDWQFVSGARGINTSQNKHRKIRRFSFAYFTIRSSFDTLNVACFVWRISRICFGALRRITPVKHTLSLCKYQFFFPVLIPKSR